MEYRSTEKEPDTRIADGKLFVYFHDGLDTVTVNIDYTPWVIPQAVA